MNGPVRLLPVGGSTRSEMRAIFSSVLRDPMGPGRANDLETKTRGKRRCTDRLGGLYHVLMVGNRLWRYLFGSAIDG
jgi:hypothetical protein